MGEEQFAMRGSRRASEATGTHFTKVADAKRAEIKLQDVVISSAQDAPSGGGGKQPQEHITLNFAKIVFE